VSSNPLYDAIRRSEAKKALKSTSTPSKYSSGSGSDFDGDDSPVKTAAAGLSDKERLARQEHYFFSSLTILLQAIINKYVDKAVEERIHGGREVLLHVV
jgi:hypothetical protein